MATTGVTRLPSLTVALVARAMAAGTAKTSSRGLVSTSAIGSTMNSVVCLGQTVAHDQGPCHQAATSLVAPADQIVPTGLDTPQNLPTLRQLPPSQAPRRPIQHLRRPGHRAHLLNQHLPKLTP